jgi:hypothetical protein
MHEATNRDGVGLLLVHVIQCKEVWLREHLFTHATGEMSPLCKEFNHELQRKAPNHSFPRVLMAFSSFIHGS